MLRAAAVFTIEAVNALVPRLRAVMETQMGRRAEIEGRLGRLAEMLGAPPVDLELDDRDPPSVRELKRDLASRIDVYRAGWRELEEMGAMLKDAREGLVDFYGRVDGQLVCLCWKYGERAVTHYHGLHEGYKGRKPIEATMLRRHLN